MIDVSTTMEVDQWLQSDLGGNILRGLCCLELFRSCVEAVDICLVVVFVVDFHNLAGYRGLKSTEVIYSRLAD